MTDYEEPEYVYTIRIPVNVHGWEEAIEVEVSASNQWEACTKLGRFLSDLLKKP